MPPRRPRPIRGPRHRARRAGTRSSTATVTRMPADLERRPPAAPLERRDPPLPAAGPAARPLPDPPRVRFRPARGRRRRRLGSGRRPSVALGALDRRVEGRRGDASRARAPARRRTDLVTQVVDDPFRLRARRPHRLVAFAACAAPFLVGDPQRFGGAQLGGPRAVERLARRALGLADRGEGLLERPLRLGQARPRVGDDRVRQPEPLGDREGLAATGQPDRQPVRRRQRLEVELDRRVPRARASCGRTP